MKSVKKSLLVVGLIVLAMSCMTVSASADIIQYSTTAVFSCTGVSGGCSVSGDTVTIGFTSIFDTSWFKLDFTGVTNVMVDTSLPFNPSNISYGSIKSTATSSGATIDSGGSDEVGFTITIHQTQPSVGSDTLFGTIVGAIKANASTGQLEFILADQPANIGQEHYTVNTNFALVAPDSNNGVTTIQGQVLSTPEPASLALLGSGMLMGGSFARRKLKR